MQIKAIKTRVFKERENLTDFILEYTEAIPEKSVFAITSKIVSLAEGRTAPIKKREFFIRKESTFFLPNSWFSIKNNLIMPAAGIDESNGNGKLVLLPRDSYKSAETIRKSLKRKLKVKQLGVLITDSGFLPLRKGAVGIALGYAGFEGIKNYIGQKDIFGRKLKYSRTNIPDSLATAAVLEMGEGNEQRPLVLITKAPVIFTEKVSKKELQVSPKRDIFYPLLKNLRNAKKKR